MPVVAQMNSALVMELMELLKRHGNHLPDKLTYLEISASADGVVRIRADGIGLSLEDV